jgi:hypothetical protein
VTINTLAPGEKDMFKIVAMLRELAQGRSNATGTVTLAPNAGSTTVTAVTCATGATVMLTPTTADAAAEIKNGTLWISAVGNQSFTITHANNAQADRTFLWAAYG